MYKALHLSPMIPSYNLEETATFFKDLLGFAQEMDTPTYAILSKDGLTIHLLNAGTDIGQMEFYLEIDDVDTLWQSIKDKMTGIKVREPFDRDYGMREMHIVVPHTNTLLFVGSVIR
jgi:catechol 2,3-dioxygenase-like lactoylglutathione lyase family enzyme